MKISSPYEGNYSIPRVPLFLRLEPIIAKHSAYVDNYSVMRKILLMSLMVLLTAFPLFAEKASEVSLRYSRQDGMIRLVVESDDALIEHANTVTSLSAIKIELTAPFEIKKPKDFIFEVTKKNHFLVINLRDVAEIKTFKLSSPARLVFDLKTSAKNQGDTLQPGAEKPQQVPSQQTDQKKQQGNGQQGQKLPLQPGRPVEKAQKSLVFVIDPGHGGYEYGIISEGAREKDINLNLARDLAAALTKKSRAVFLTRKADQSVSLNDRINFANSKNPDIFISIHSSLSDSFAVYVSTVDDQNVDDAAKLYSLFSRQIRHIGKSRSLSRAIGKSLENEFKKDVFLRELPLPVLYSMNSAAVLIEYPSPQSFDSDPNMRDRFVNSVLRGISAYEQ